MHDEDLSLNRLRPKMLLEEGRLAPSTLDDFVRAIHKCRKEKNSVYALHMHVCLCDNGLEGHRSLGNYLVWMLVEVGSIDRAQQVFNKLVLRNESSWNALISGYVKQGMTLHALTIYQEMSVDDSLHPSTDVFVALLQACTKLKDVKRGVEIHNRIGTLECDLFVGSTLIAMYGKFGWLDRAQQVFHKLHVQNIVSWTALITGYADQGLGEKALEFFRKMREKGVLPNAVTYVCILKACGSIRATHWGQEMHAEVASQGLLETNLFIGSALVDMYSKCGMLVKAQRAFDKLPVRSAVLWNTLISVYSENGQDEKVFECFEKMCSEGVSPNGITFTCILKACGNSRAIEVGRCVHAEVERRQLLEREPLVGNALINMYARCDSLPKAQQVFNTLPIKDVVSWTVLMAGYVEHEHGEDALECLEQLQAKGFSPRDVTYIYGLKACGGIGAVDRGEEIHAEIERRGLMEDALVGSTLVDMYARCGSLAKAEQVFEKLPARNVVSWTALIAGYTQLNQSEAVFVNFNKMLGEGVKPSLITFVVVLNACSHGGLCHRMQTYFEAMSQDYGIAPMQAHHTCMLGLLGRVGHLDHAQSLVKKLPLAPDIIMWHTVLSACKNLGNAHCGEHAFINTQHV